MIDRIKQTERRERSRSNLIVGGIRGGDHRSAAPPLAVDVAARVPRADSELRQELELFTESHRSSQDRDRKRGERMGDLFWEN